jgi:MFS family permease
MFSAVGVTLPALGKDLHAGGIALGLVEAVYIGASSAVLLPLGKLADLTDRRAIFKAGLLLFSLATLLLGLVNHIEAFIALRLLQGIAAAMMLATNLAILSEIIPKNSLGRAFGFSVGAVYVGLSTGPFIAGILTTHLGWRWVFHVGAVFAGFASLLSFRNIPSRGRLRFVKIDIWGSISIMGAITLLIAGSSLQDTGYAGYGIMLAGLALFALFVRIEGRTKDPLIRISMITENRVFTRAVLVQLISYAATFALTFLFSLYLQSVKGMTPQQAGFILMTAPVTMALLSPFFGRLSDRISPQKIAFTGMSSCFIAICGAGSISLGSPVWHVLAVFVCHGAGMAMFSSPNMNIIMNCVEKHQYGIASALAANMRTLGMVLSMVIVITYISVFIGHNTISAANAARYMTAMHFSVMSFIILSAFGLLLSLHISKKPGRP